jgi:hypothetical protein
MPTIFRIGAARVVIYLNDHLPAHVQVLDGGQHAVFNLHCPHGPPAMLRNHGSRKSTQTLSLAGCKT